MSAFHNITQVGLSPISANLGIQGKLTGEVEIGSGRQGQAQPLQDGTPPEADGCPLVVAAGLAPAFGPIDACVPKFAPMGLSPPFSS
jgi:hypothetical protein